MLQILTKTQIKYTKLGSLQEKLKLQQNENLENMNNENPGKNEANSLIWSFLRYGSFWNLNSGTFKWTLCLAMQEQINTLFGLVLIYMCKALLSFITVHPSHTASWCEGSKFSIKTSTWLRITRGLIIILILVLKTRLAWTFFQYGNLKIACYNDFFDYYFTL